MKFTVKNDKEDSVRVFYLEQVHTGIRLYEETTGMEILTIRPGEPILLASSIDSGIGFDLDDEGHPEVELE